MATRSSVPDVRASEPRRQAAGAGRPDARLREHAPAKATTFQLAFLTYTVVCGGAYGLEEMVSISGPGLSVLVLLVLPFVYAAPLALTCAELTARFPIEGGYYRWVRMAFNDGVGYTAGWLAWVAMFATNASFAVLFANYLRYFVPNLSEVAHLGAAAAVVWVAVGLNYAGIRLVGSMSVMFTILILLPFGAMTVMGFVHWQHNPLLPIVNPDTTTASALFSGILIAMWLYGGFEKLTVTAEEVHEPARAFPIALAIAVPLCASSYILPTVAALAANGDWRDWGASHYMTAAAKIGGPWLGAAVAAGALVSNAGLLMVTVLSQSRLPMVLGEDGFFPKVFGIRHPRFGTPWVSLVVTGTVLTALCTIPFAELVAAAALVQSVSYLLLYAALFKLRARAGALNPRGFSIPLGTAGLSVMFAPSVLIVLLVAYHGLFPEGQLDRQQALFNLIVFGSAPITYALTQRRPWRARAATRSSV